MDERRTLGVGGAVSAFPLNQHYNSEHQQSRQEDCKCNLIPGATVVSVVAETRLFGFLETGERVAVCRATVDEPPNVDASSIRPGD